VAEFVRIPAPCGGIRENSDLAPEPLHFGSPPILLDFWYLDHLAAARLKDVMIGCLNIAVWDGVNEAVELRG
jgi:hypothetical protein